MGNPKRATLILGVVAVLLGMIMSVVGSAMNELPDGEPLSTVTTDFIPSHTPSVEEPPPDTRRDVRQFFIPKPAVIPPVVVVQPPKPPKPAVQPPKPKKPVQSVKSSTPRPTPAPAPVAGTAAEKALAFALAQRGKPYVYGATGPGSYDCSGLVMRAYQSAGIQLPRTTRTMISRGTPVSRSALVKGDLVWTSSGHMGIYSGNGKIVHSPQSGDVVKESPIWSFYAARRI